MNKYKRLKDIRENFSLLPGLRTGKDFDIAIEIGDHELRGMPLTHKQLMLLEIASQATVRRHIDDLVTKGTVVKHTHPDDQRTIYFTLSKHTHEYFDHFINQLQDTVRSWKIQPR